MSSRDFPIGTSWAGHAWAKGRVIVCAACGTKDQVSSAKNVALPNEVAHRKFQQRGWHVGTRERDDRCPACVEKERTKKVNTPAPQKTPTPPTPAASKRITDLYLYLEDHYDRDRKGYRNGWSDEKIAEELALAVDLVARRREQDFGPIIRDTLLDDIKQAEASVTVALTTMQLTLDEAMRIQERLVRDQATLRELVGRVSARLAAKS